jgi:hypothetical protein
MVESMYYRINSVLVSAGVDEWDNPLGPARVHVYVQKLEVIAKTPKGIWLNYYGKKRLVLDASRKRFACPTLEQAKESFRMRKARQLKILRRQIANAEAALAAVDELVDTPANLAGRELSMEVL